MKVATYEADITSISGLVFPLRVCRYLYESGSGVSLVTSQKLDDWLRFPAETAVFPVQQRPNLHLGPLSLT
jgi:hypothetical protein